MALTEGIKECARTECPGIDESFYFTNDWEHSQSLEMMRRIKGTKSYLPKVEQVTLSAR